MLKRRVVRNPKKEAITFGLILLAVIAIFFAVLNYATARQYRSSAEFEDKQLRYSLTMPKTSYAESEPIPIRLTVTNISKEPVTLSFDKDLEFDVIIKRDVNLIFATVPFDVWKYSASNPGAKSRHQQTIQPGKALVYDATWPQVNSEGEPVAGGRYRITGVINIAKNKQTLEIRGGTQ